MSTADEGHDSGLVRPDGSMWGRREFVGAMGAGIIAAGIPSPWETQATTVAITFHGALLVTQNEAKNRIEILFPKAEGSGRKPRYDDDFRANKHISHLIYTVIIGGAMQDVNIDLEKQLVLEATPTLPTLHLGAMFRLDKNTKATTLRPFTDAATFLDHYSCRITLGGGTLTAVADPDVGEWGMPPVFVVNPSSPYPYPATTLVWESGRTNVAVGNLSRSLTLYAALHKDIQIGHQPKDPSRWGEKPTGDEIPVEGMIDHDFKMLYDVVIPDDANPQDKYPWKKRLKKRLLPAPTCVTGNPNKGAGTPTCFGGCYNCD